MDAVRRRTVAGVSGDVDDAAAQMVVGGGSGGGRGARYRVRIAQHVARAGARQELRTRCCRRDPPRLRRGRRVRDEGRHRRRTDWRRRGRRQRRHARPAGRRIGRPRVVDVPRRLLLDPGRRADTALVLADFHVVDGSRRRRARRVRLRRRHVRRRRRRRPTTAVRCRRQRRRVGRGWRRAEHTAALLELFQAHRVRGVQLHLHVTQQVRLLGEQLRADDAVIERHACGRVVLVAGDAQQLVGQSRVNRHVLDIAGLVAVALVADVARVALLPGRGRRRRTDAQRVAGTAGAATRRRRRRRLRIGTGHLDEVRQRATAGEDAPVVRVILVDVAEEAHLVGTVFLADLTRQVVRSSETRVQLNVNVTHTQGQN